MFLLQLMIIMNDENNNDDNQDDVEKWYINSNKTK